MLLKLFKLDKSPKEAVCTLSTGNHSLGRGTTLDCYDQRVSRNHILFDVKDDKVTIKLLHKTNPCYWKQADSTHMTLLSFNIPIDVHNGDMFGFFPDISWYRIEYSSNTDAPNSSKIADIDLSSNVVNNEGSEPPETNLLQNEKEINHIKFPCTSRITTPENQEIETSNSEVEIKKEISEDDKTIDEVPIEQGNHPLINEGPSCSGSNDCNRTKDPCTSNITKPENQEIERSNSEIEIKTEISEDDKKIDEVPIEQGNHPLINEGPSFSGSTIDAGNIAPRRQFRDRCWYGSACYRKNQSHKEKYSHEGDDDYDTDPSDDRPLCPYGRQCYRRNISHRRDYKHSSKISRKRIGDTDESDITSANILHTKRIKKMNSHVNTNSDDSEENPFSTDEEDDFEDYDDYMDSDD